MYPKERSYLQGATRITVQQQSAVLINKVWVGMRDLWCWILQKNDAFAVQAAFALTPLVHLNLCGLTALTNITCQKPHGTCWLLRVIIHHGLLDTPLHWLSDLSWRSKEAIQSGRPSTPVIPPQQEGFTGDIACVSGLPTTQFPLWNSHGFLELRCCGKWSDQALLFPVTQN